MIIKILLLTFIFSYSSAPRSQNLNNITNLITQEKLLQINIDSINFVTCDSKIKSYKIIKTVNKTQLVKSILPTKGVIQKSFITNINYELGFRNNYYIYDKNNSNTNIKIKLSNPIPKNSLISINVDKIPRNVLIRSKDHIHSLGSTLLFKVDYEIFSLHFDFGKNNSNPIIINDISFTTDDKVPIANLIYIDGEEYFSSSVIPNSDCIKEIVGGSSNSERKISLIPIVNYDNQEALFSNKDSIGPGTFTSPFSNSSLVSFLYYSQILLLLFFFIIFCYIGYQAYIITISISITSVLLTCFLFFLHSKTSYISDSFLISFYVVSYFVFFKIFYYKLKKFNEIFITVIYSIIILIICFIITLTSFEQLGRFFGVILFYSLISQILIYFRIIKLRI